MFFKYLQTHLHVCIGILLYLSICPRVLSYITINKEDISGLERLKIYNGYKAETRGRRGFLLMILNIFVLRICCYFMTNRFRHSWSWEKKLGTQCQSEIMDKNCGQEEGFPKCAYRHLRVHLQGIEGYHWWLHYQLSWASPS